MVHYKLFVLVNKDKYGDHDLNCCVYENICQYDEHICEQNECDHICALYDWYEIGGRWSGLFDGVNCTEFKNIVEEKYGCNMICLENEIHINKKYDFLSNDEERYNFYVYDENEWNYKKKELADKYVYNYVVIIDCHI